MNKPTLARRRLGRDGPEISAIGLGCMGMSEFYGPADDAQSLGVLNHALDLGLNFLDTADVYGSGANERLLSQVLRTRREEVVLATKFGFVRGADGKIVGIDGRPERVRQACDDSLQRLGTDHIDLYYLHRADPKVPIEETVGAMAELVRAGKVRHLGLSEVSGNTLRRAAKVHPIAALQSEYSLWTREIEANAGPACVELGVTLVAYSPLGRGFLTGAIQSTDGLAANDFRVSNPRFQPGNIDTNLALVRALGDLARAHGCSSAQLALAWLLHRSPNVVPIPGTRRIERLEENAGAVAITLSAADIARIEELLASQPVAGARYTPQFMSLLNA